MQQIGLLCRSQTRQTLATLLTLTPYNPLKIKALYLKSLLQWNECINNNNNNMHE